MPEACAGFRKCLLLPVLSVVLLLGISGRVMAQDVELRTLFCPIISEAPTIDGVVNEDEWSESTTIDELTRSRSSVENEESGNVVTDTIIRVMADESTLYVALICGGPDGKPKEPKERERDGFRATDNIVQVFVDLDHDHKTNKMFGVLDTMAGDESSWGEHWGEEYLAKFRVWLKEQHGSLEALNAEWGSDFEEWDAVMPFTEKEAREANRFGPWVDFRFFDAHAISTWQSEFRRGLHDADPEARLSLSGTGNPRPTNCTDWVRLVKSCDVIRIYGTYQQALARSFKPSLRTARYTGYGAEQPHCHPWHWKLIFEGGSGISECSERQLLNPDLTYSRSAGIFARDMISITRGPGKAIVNAERHNGQIRMHYSYPSTVVAHMLDRYNPLDAIHITRLAMCGAWKSWGVINETGHTYNFISNEQIENDMLRTDEDVKLIFLTHAFAMSEKEAAELERWVKAGGILVSDLAPGGFTNHGKPREKGLLDELFGVDRSKAELVIAETNILPAGVVDGVRLEGEAKITAFEKGLVAKKAKNTATIAGAETPAVLVNKVGKGLAVLFNGDPFVPYKKVSDERWKGNEADKKAEILDKLFLSLVDAAEIEPTGDITAADGKPIYLSYFAKFKAGKVIYLCYSHGIGHDDRAALPLRDVTMKLPEKTNAYDVLEDKFYANTDKVSFSMPYMFVKILALMPYEVEGIETDLPDSTHAGEVVRFKLSIQASEPTGDHVIRMEVLGPDGKDRWYLAQNILLKGGKAEAAIPFALNDPKGRWTIRLRDITSGQRLERTLKLTQ